VSVRASIVALERTLQHLQNRVTFLTDQRDERQVQARKYQADLDEVERDMDEIRSAIETLKRSA
jgi:chromosome segregation ATPase